MWLAGAALKPGFGGELDFDSEEPDFDGRLKEGDLGDFDLVEPIPKRKNEGLERGASPGDDAREELFIHPNLGTCVQWIMKKGMKMSRTF